MLWKEEDSKNPRYAGLSSFVGGNINEKWWDERKDALHNDSAKAELARLRLAYKNDSLRWSDSYPNQGYYYLSDALRDIYKKDCDLVAEAEKVKEEDAAKISQQKDEQAKQDFDKKWKAAESELPEIKAPDDLKRSLSDSAEKPIVLTLKDWAYGTEACDKDAEVVIKAVYGQLKEGKENSYAFAQSALNFSQTNKTLAGEDKVKMTLLLLHTAAREDADKETKKLALEALYNFSADKEVRMILAQPESIVVLSEIKTGISESVGKNSDESQLAQAQKSHDLCLGLLSEAKVGRQEFKDKEEGKDSIKSAKDAVEQMSAEDRTAIQGAISSVKGAFSNVDHSNASKSIAKVKPSEERAR